MFCIRLFTYVVRENKFLVILLKGLRSYKVINTLYTSFDMIPKSLCQVHVVTVQHIDVLTT